MFIDIVILGKMGTEYGQSKYAVRWYDGNDFQTGEALECELVHITELEKELDFELDKIEKDNYVEHSKNNKRIRGWFGLAD